MAASIPLSVTAQATEAYVWDESDSPATALTAAYALSGIHIRNESTNEVTFALQHGDGFGAFADFDKVTLADGESYVREFFPFMRLVGSKIRFTHDGASDTGITVSINYVSISQIRI